jgi:acetyl-CoA C-acetyltransferase
VNSRRDGEYLQQPMIVGVGQYTDRDVDGVDNPDPVGLMLRAMDAALTDAGLTGRAGLIDSIDVVNTLSWRYADDAAAALCRRADLTADHQKESPVGGEQPVALLDDLARRVHRDEVSLGLIVGAEAQASLNHFRRAGLTAPWPPKPGARVSVTSTLKHLLHPEAWRHGLCLPVQIYPLFENALCAHRGQNFSDAQEESARLWSEMSKVASHNAFAWNAHAYATDEIATPSPWNRWIYYPYPKLMNASPAVNQAAALLVTNRKTARMLGVPDDRLVQIAPGAGARELADPFARSDFYHSPAMEAVLDAALERAEAGPSDLDAVELYSCFPCVPKMAREHLSLKSDMPVTVAGGLSFFGGPGNNYMTHATAAMVQQVRAGQCTAGLVYGQGEFVTKHHALVLRANETPTTYRPVESAISTPATPSPEMAAEPSGRGVVETFTASWNPDSTPHVAAVVGLLEDSGRRFIAHTPVDDKRSFAVLTDPTVRPVGLPVQVQPGLDTNQVVVDKL